MVTNSHSPHGPHSPWGARLGTLALWAAAGASVVFWGLRLSAPAAQAMLPAVPDAVAPDAQALARLLGALPSSAPGAAAPVAAPPGRFALIGVLSGRRSGGGAAGISGEGEPARPIRLGGAAGPVRGGRCAVGSPQWRRRGADCGRWQPGPTIPQRGCGRPRAAAANPGPPSGATGPPYGRACHGDSGHAAEGSGIAPAVEPLRCHRGGGTGGHRGRLQHGLALSGGARCRALSAGAGRYLGVALVAVDVPDAALRRLATQGFRVLRFHFMRHIGGAARIEEVLAPTPRLAAVGHAFA